ncbi:LysR family transcriptional regulator [Aquibaculum sediminis]|uniref:LysR family transcriptional regulator n=1 Tax=Aquibaculum sediminis TaxID=3231907 RepID=UPI0034562CAF
MDVDLLRAFVAVADSGGFSAAARVLNRTQSAVSLQIKRLEAQLGAPLFNRTSRQVVLNDAGGTLLPYARRLLRLQEEARDAIGRSGDMEVLRLGLPDEQAQAYLADLLAPFARTHPDVQLSIYCDRSDLLVERLLDGLLDLVLAIRHDPASGGEHVANEPLVWVGAETLALSARARVPLAVHAEGCPYRAEAVSQLGRRGRRWHVTFTSQSPTGINLAIQAGLGITVKAARSVPEGCRVLGEAEGLPPLQPAIAELHRNPATTSLAADALAEQLVGAVREQQADP